MMCKGCLLDYIKSSSDCPVCRESVNVKDVIQVDDQGPSTLTQSPPRKKRPASPPPRNPVDSFVSEGGRLRMSSKLEWLAEHLQKLREEEPDTKVLPTFVVCAVFLTHMTAQVVIFSQWTGMLDLIGGVLSAHSFTFTRLDGSMRYLSWPGSCVLGRVTCVIVADLSARKL